MIFRVSDPAGLSVVREGCSKVRLGVLCTVWGFCALLCVLCPPLFPALRSVPLRCVLQVRIALSCDCGTGTCLPIKKEKLR
jgi:hypothetical protein